MHAEIKDNNTFIPEKLNSLLVKLRVISMIEEGYKLDLSTMSYTYNNSWIGSFMRIINSQNRKGLILALKQIIKEGIISLKDPTYFNTVR